MRSREHIYAVPRSGRVQLFVMAHDLGKFPKVGRTAAPQKSPVEGTSVNGMPTLWYHAGDDEVVMDRDDGTSERE